MPLFLYQAIDQSGRTRTGEIQAADKAAAVVLLERQHLTPISVISTKGEAAGVAAKAFSTTIFKGRITAVDKILLTKHLAAVVKAGLSLHEALEILWADTKKPILKQVLFDAKVNLERGLPLSSVFEMYPRFFSPVFVGLIRAGEKSGTLEDALKNLGDQLLRDTELVRKVRQAMIYPSILLIASLGVVLLLLTFLLPRLIKVFGTTKVQLPLITRFFVAVSGVLSAKPLLTVLIFLMLVGAAVFVFISPRGRTFMVARLQRLPLAGELIKKLSLSRFTRTFNNLLKSGIGALEALEITAQTVGNQLYHDALLEVRDEIRKGSSLSAAFRPREALFPRLLVSMVTVGERTGTLEVTLKTIADFYDEEVDRTLKTLVGLLEPVLLLVMGLVVGGIALSVILPIYQLVSSFR